VAARLTEAAEYRRAWQSPDVAALLDERRQAWVDILAAVAREQAVLGIIPDWAAHDIGNLRAADLDLDLVARRTAETSHSTLGLIEALQLLLPERSREFVYYGLTVQDLTDTWFAILMRDTARAVRADLCRCRDAAAGLAARHRDTPMAGRTHGQPGSPITFGLKAATWADELDRAIGRVDEGSRRWSTVQLAGSTGTLAFFGEIGPALRAAIAGALGLADPGISWTGTRDRVAEFGTVMALATGALARVGDEVFELQRPEVAEIAEPLVEGAVGSITMPHKRNPEYAEHLSTLNRLVRAATGVLLEGLVSVHERDGRSWKAEWAAIPDIALYSGRAASIAADLLEGLRVDTEAMARNLGPGAGSESLLIELSARLGKHAAQSLLQQQLTGRAPTEAAADIAASAGVDVAEVLAWIQSPPTGSAGAMVDEVVGRQGVQR